MSLKWRHKQTFTIHLKVSFYSFFFTRKSNFVLSNSTVWTIVNYNFCKIRWAFLAIFFCFFLFLFLVLWCIDFCREKDTPCRSRRCLTNIWRGDFLRERLLIFFVSRNYIEYFFSEFAEKLKRWNPVTSDTPLPVHARISFFFQGG